MQPPLEHPIVIKKSSRVLHCSAEMLHERVSRQLRTYLLYVACSGAGWHLGRSQGRDVASFAKQDCGKSLWTLRVSVCGFLFHHRDTVSQSLGLSPQGHSEPEPGASRLET